MDQSTPEQNSPEHLWWQTSPCQSTYWAVLMSGLQQVYLHRDCGQWIKGHAGTGTSQSNSAHGYVHATAGTPWLIDKAPPGASTTLRNCSLWINPSCSRVKFIVLFNPRSGPKGPELCYGNYNSRNPLNQERTNLTRSSANAAVT